MSKKNIDINQVFKRISEKIVKYRWWIIAAVIIINIIAILGMTRLKKDSSSESFLLESSQIRQAEEEFEAVFGNDEFVALLFEAEDVFSPRALTMIRELGDELEAKIPFADKVTSLADFEFSSAVNDEIIIGPLLPEVIPTAPEEIEGIRKKAFSKPFLVNRLFSDDSRQTWLLLHLLSYPPEWKSAEGDEPRIAVGKAVLKLLEQEKYKKFSIKPLGKPVREYEDSMYFGLEAMRVIMLATLMAVVVLIILLRSFWGVLVPLITTASSIIIVFGFMGLLGIKMNQSLMTLPVYLGLALSIGYSIHLFNFFKRNFLITGKRKESVSYALEHTGWPLLFTALTTIGCLLSFYFVPIKPIQWVGFTSAAVIFSVYIIVIVFYPALLSFGKDKEPKPEHAETRELWADKFYIRLGEWVLKHSVPIIIVFVICVSIVTYGLTKIEINTDFRRTFGFKLPHIARLNYVSQTKVGSMLSYNLALRFQESDKIKDPQVLKNFEKLAAGVSDLRLTRRVSSILDILKDMNQLFNTDNPRFYRIPETREQVSQLLLIYEVSGGTEAERWIDPDYTVLRLMVETGDFDNNEMLIEFEEVKRLAAELLPEAELTLVGNMVESVIINDLISTGEMTSFLAALVTIMFLMMIVFRSIVTGLIGLIPNIAPPLFVGGLMGLFGIPLDFMTMTIMPMLLGLAVDDTIHFIIHSKLEYQRTGDYRESILHTFKTVGKALFMTTFILSVSFIIYTSSAINMFVYLGLFTVIGIMSALLTDFFVTPVLVNWVRPFKKK